MFLDPICGSTFWGAQHGATQCRQISRQFLAQFLAEFLAAFLAPLLAPFLCGSLVVFLRGHGRQLNPKFRLKSCRQLRRQRGDGGSNQEFWRFATTVRAGTQNHRFGGAARAGSACKPKQKGGGASPPTFFNEFRSRPGPCSPSKSMISGSGPDPGCEQNHNPYFHSLWQRGDGGSNQGFRRFATTVGPGRNPKSLIFGGCAGRVGF